MIHNRKIIYLSGFLFSLPVALMSYINSSFLSSFAGEKLVGIIYALASTLSILVLLIVPGIFRKMGGYRFLLGVIGLDAISVLLLALSKNAWTAIPIFTLVFTFNTLVFFSLDEILKIFSKDSSIGEIRGIYLSVCHLALISTQLVFAIILGGYSFQIVYFTSFTVMMLFLAVSFFKLKKIPDPEYDKMRIWKYLGKFLRNKNLFRAYVMNFLLQFFYCWMIIYTPIYLSGYLGFNWKEIGLIFAIMLTPFILIPFRLGKYGDKIGERKILMSGFAVASIATLSLFFIREHNIWLWAALLFATRIGAATIEVMSDAYFFRRIKPENDEFVGVYRSALPVAYIIGPLLASIIFIFAPVFNFIYIILSIIMLFGVYLSSTIRKDDI